MWFSSYFVLWLSSSILSRVHLHLSVCHRLGRKIYLLGQHGHPLQWREDVHLQNMGYWVGILFMSWGHSNANLISTAWKKLFRPRDLIEQWISFIRMPPVFCSNSWEKLCTTKWFLEVMECELWRQAALPFCPYVIFWEKGFAMEKTSP